MPQEWWKTASIYQIYPRSFQDSNGDGIGDLQGIRSRLTYLKDLGVDCLWLSPFYKSPMEDFGYDVADYCSVDPIFGNMGDFDKLLEDTHRLGMRLIIDLVPNHTSDQHAWFKESRRSRDNPKRDWYVWRDPAEGGGPPNNWMAYFGGPAWTLDPVTGQYYLHQFLPSQPDLNFRNLEMREAMYEAMRFWLRKGVDGFRVDVMWLLVEDAEFRDEPPNPDWKEGEWDRGRHLHIYTEDQPETRQVVREMRQVLEEFGGDRVMVGEMYLPYHQLMPYYGTAESPACHLPFNFHLIFRGLPNWTAENIRAIVEEYEAALPPFGTPNWVLGNHDQHRLATRVGQAQARVAAMLLFTLRGSPTWYYGDEIGMVDGAIPLERMQDPAGLRQLKIVGEHGLAPTRDPERTPMQWTPHAFAGFSSREPWLPVTADYLQRNVEAQDADPESMLTLVRTLLLVRREVPDLLEGPYQTYKAPGGVFAYLRGGSTLVALNFTDQPKTVGVPAGDVLLSTHLERYGTVSDRLELRPNEGIILRLT
ncbi:MAG: alpha-amylase family glycosyl hydrolase [Meiothermus sp.]|nr:alpha-amylase family glycosyl hydrolase [Meiothermus sp.]